MRLGAESMKNRTPVWDNYGLVVTDLNLGSAMAVENGIPVCVKSDWLTNDIWKPNVLTKVWRMKSCVLQ